MVFEIPFEKEALPYSFLLLFSSINMITFDYMNIFSPTFYYEFFKHIAKVKKF